MTTAIRLFAYSLRLPRLMFPRLFGQNARRRQATVDLLHSSPHLLRDIGALDEHFVARKN